MPRLVRELHPGAAKPRVRTGIEPGMNTITQLSRSQHALSWLLQLVAAAILAQTLFFKFTGAEESIYIFSTLGAEPIGRIGSGLLELVASILLLIPSTAALGAILALGLMAGALLGHLTVLGIVIKGDGGLLFVLALVVFTCAAVVLFLRRADLPCVGRYFQVMS
jgi:putative oxidoreductase